MLKRSCALLVACGLSLLTSRAHAEDEVPAVAFVVFGAGIAVAAADATLLGYDVVKAAGGERPSRGAAVAQVALGVPQLVIGALYIADGWNQGYVACTPSGVCTSGTQPGSTSRRVGSIALTLVPATMTAVGLWTLLSPQRSSSPPRLAIAPSLGSDGGGLVVAGVF